MSTRDWKYEKILPKFGEQGCSISGCSFHYPGGCASAQVWCCALNLSDAIIRAGYALPSASDVNYCNHTTAAARRVRNADGMARIVRNQNDGKIDASEWKNRPSWKGIVFFEGGLSLDRAAAKAPDDYQKLEAATGHIDLWDGKGGVHAEYPNADVIWFWRLG